MVFLVRFLSIKMSRIARSEGNAKFVRKDIQHLCIIIKQKSKVKEPDGNSSNEPKVHINCATANTISDVISMCVVPVLAQHKLCVCIVKTYAMVDNCGQATFM